MLLGYARVSMHDQNLDLQKDALKGASCEKVFLDAMSSSKKHRPGLERALDSLRKGD
jgi:DNA invertase Pin-like site-specific DNA recombinase